MKRHMFILSTAARGHFFPMQQADSGYCSNEKWSAEMRRCKRHSWSQVSNLTAPALFLKVTKQTS